MPGEEAALCNLALCRRAGGRLRNLGNTLRRNVGFRAKRTERIRPQTDIVIVGSCHRLTGAGLLLTQRRTLPAAPAYGGGLLGAGIAAMHYTGMAAYEIAGLIMWDVSLVAASLVFGVLLGAAALQVALSGRGALPHVLGALLLLLAIVSHHFTAMGAVTIVPDPTIQISETALPPRWVAVGVAVASLGILFLACALWPSIFTSVVTRYGSVSASTASPMLPSKDWWSAAGIASSAPTTASVDLLV